MATWPKPQFDPPLLPFSSRCVGVWFAQFEAALELNTIWHQEFKYEVLFHVLQPNLQLCLGVPSPGPRPYDELRQSILTYYGAAYHPLAVADHTMRESLPASPPPVLPASRPVPISHHQASLPPSTCPDTVSATTQCATAQSPASGSLQGSLSCEYAHDVVAEGIVTTMTPATSSPFSPPTMAGDSGDIADPTPATVPHAIGSVSNAIAPATTPDPSTRSAEPVSVAARELGTVPIPLPPTLPANAAADVSHDLLQYPTSTEPYLQRSAQSSAQLAQVTPSTQPTRVFTCAASADICVSSLSASRPRPAPGFWDVAVPAAFYPSSGVLNEPSDTPAAPDPTFPGRSVASSRCTPSPDAPDCCRLPTGCATSTCNASVVARPALATPSLVRAPYTPRNGAVRNTPPTTLARVPPVYHSPHRPPRSSFKTHGPIIISSAGRAPPNSVRSASPSTLAELPVPPA